MTRNMQQPKACEQCGAVMLVPPAKMNRKRFCSRACHGRSKIQRVNVVRPSPATYAKPPVRRGADNNKFVPAIKLTCKQCGVGFEKKPWRLRCGHTGEFCSFECKTAFWVLHRKGEQAPDWCGGSTTYRGKGWNEARAQVVAEQGGRCDQCDKHVGASLPVHHRKPFRLFATAEEANQRSNLVGLCQSCHMKAERLIDLDARNLPMARERIASDAPLFAEISESAA